MPSYPRPTNFLPTVSLPTRRLGLLPLERPPHEDIPLASLPPLPSSQRKSLLHPSWSMTTHLVPAAFPRTTPYFPPHKLPTFDGDENKAEYQKEVGRLAREVLDLKERDFYHGPTAERDTSVLWTCVNRYVNNPSPTSSTGLTLLFAHANGFPKEIWEPTLSHLVSSLQLSKAQVDEIWVWEAVNHGDAALVNAPNLSGIYDWKDNARDILHFLLHYLPSSPFEPQLPIHLHRIPDPLAEQRERTGLEKRKLVVVGHSFGGCSSILAGLTTPSLFSSIVLVDSIVRPQRPGAPISSPGVREYVGGAIGRRHHWSSREEARASFDASPFFGKWDKKVLDVYVECGLMINGSDGEEGVELKMPGIQEAQVFTESVTTYEAFERLDSLDPNIELRWIMPGRSPEQNGTAAQELVWRRPINSSHVIFSEAGHLIPQEVPRELAEEIAAFLDFKYSSFTSKL